MSQSKFSYKGFTLIELLIVIAIIGVLAVVVLVAINPTEQLARARDAGRKSAVNQLGHGLQTYATTHDGVVLTESATWMSDVQTEGSINTIPSSVAFADTSIVACTTNEQNGYCYDTDGNTPPNGSIIYTRLESSADQSKCPGEIAYVLYDTYVGRGGIVCSGTEPSYDPLGQTFVN
jgi:type IV pilus assembly protein PilA